MALETTIAGMRLTFNGEPEGAPDYVNGFAQELADLYIDKVMSHVTELPGILPHTWHNYVEMTAGEPIVAGRADVDDHAIVVQLPMIDDLTGSQLDPSVVRTDQKYVRINVYTRGGIIAVNYYPDIQAVVAPDIFHVFNAGGQAVMAGVIDAIKTLKLSSGMHSDDLIPPESAVVVMNGKVYNMQLQSHGDLDSHYKARINGIKTAAISFERRIMSNCQNALSDLRGQRERLMRDLLSMPLQDTGLVASGVTMARYIHRGDHPDGSLFLVKDVDFVVAKVFKIGGGMAVKLPDELQIKITGRMMIRCRPGTNGKLQPRDVQCYHRDKEHFAMGVMTGVLHPHVLSTGGVCIGDYKLPPYIELMDASNPYWAVKVFDQICITLMAINPQSWYQSSADNMLQLRNWIYEHVPESDTRRR